MKWTLKDAFQVVLGIICLVLAVNIAVILTDLPEIFAESPRRSLITLLLFIIQEAIFLIPLYFWIIKKYKLKAKDIGFRKLKVPEAIKWILKAFGLVILFNIVLTLVLVRLGQPLPGFSPQESHIPLFGESALDLGIAVLVLIVIAPVIEELLFRGFLLQTFLSVTNPAIASTATALIFSVIHLEFQSIWIMFVISLILNWIFMKSRSLWPAIGFHMINNSLAFLLEWLVWKGYIMM